MSGYNTKRSPEDSISLPHDLNKQKHQTSRNKARGEVGLNTTGRGNLVGAFGIVGFCPLLGAPCMLVRAGGLTSVVSLISSPCWWIMTGSVFFCNSLDTIMIIIWFQLWVRLLYTPSPELRPQGSMLAEFTSAPRATPSTCLGDSRSYLIPFLCVL